MNTIRTSARSDQPWLLRANLSLIAGAALLMALLLVLAQLWVLKSIRQDRCARMQEAILTINQEYSQKLAAMEQVPHDQLRMDGTTPDWALALAVYTVVMSDTETSPQQISVTLARMQVLKDIFYQLNPVHSYTETSEDGQSVTLVIVRNGKTVAEAAADYCLSRAQMERLTEMLDDTGWLAQIMPPELGGGLGGPAQ